MRLALASVAGIALTAIASAQSTAYFPAAANNLEGQTSDGYSALSLGVCRVQRMFEKEELAHIPNNSALKKLGFRQDGQYRVASPGYSLQLEMFMTSTPRTASTLSATFASNYPTGGTPTTVFSKKIFALPNLAIPTNTLPAPSANTVFIPLDAPYTLSTNDNFLVEYKIYANNNANQQFAYYLDVKTHHTTNTPYGAGCTTSTNKTPKLAGTDVSLGQYWTVNLSDGTPTAPSALLVGLSKTSWNGQPLPFDLGVFGATGCKLHTDIVITLPKITGGTGAASYSIPTPGSLAYNNVSLFVQSAIYDPFANNFGIVTSAALEGTFGFPARSHLVIAQNNVSATTGYVQNNYGLVQSFEY